MTGHKDLKLANHYSKLDNEYQKEISVKIMKHISFSLKEDEKGMVNNVLKLTVKND
jgi:hypothetical protein